jgi:hypothetical protein
MGNFDRSHFKATGFDLRGFGKVPGLGGTLATSLDHAAFLVSIDRSDNPTIAAMTAPLRGQPPRQEAARVPRNDGNPYSAAAVRGRPTKPVSSPKRSTMTAGKSLALFVTQAPERTA